MNKIKNNADFFETLYTKKSDPWSFASNDYELDRYNHLLHALPEQYYNRVFEPGCSIGVLTKKIAFIANSVDAFDISPTAISLAKKRCSNLKNINFQCQALENVLPHMQTDLIILSEIGYYFNADTWQTTVIKLLNNCENTTLLMGHWLGKSSDHILKGDEVHEIIESIAGLYKEYSKRTKQFRIDCWRKR
jgi:SAM-dependent methyltransferase